MRHTIIDERATKIKVMTSEYSSALYADFLKSYIAQAVEEGLLILQPHRLALINQELDEIRV
jgi:hypothetical protein